MIFNVTNLRKFKKFHKFLTKNGYKPELNIELKNIRFWDVGGSVFIGKSYFYWNGQTTNPKHLSFPKNLDKILDSLKLKEQYYKDNKENKQEVKMKYNYTVTPDSIVIFAGAKPYIARKDHLNFEKIKSLVKGKQFEKAVKLFDISAAITANSKGKITVKNSVVYWNDKPLHNYVTNRLLTLLKEEFDVKPVINFLEDLYNNNPLVKENPNHYLVEDLYKFLSGNDLPLTEDGGFLAWKRVRKTGYDIHSNTVKYEVGKVVEESFDKVDKNRDNHCSYGLHFCAKTYLEKSNFGSNVDNKMLLVKVMPSWVCSIPSDYGNSKGRAHKMFVYAEYDDNSDVKINKSVVSNSYQKRDKNGRFCKN